MVRLEEESDAERAVAAVGEMSDDRPVPDGLCGPCPVRKRSGVIAEAVRRLDDADVVIDDIVLRRPTLDDVFLALTGRPAEEPSSDQTPDEVLA